MKYYFFFYFLLLQIVCSLRSRPCLIYFPCSLSQYNIKISLIKSQLNSSFKLHKFACVYDFIYDNLLWLVIEHSHLSDNVGVMCIIIQQYKTLNNRKCFPHFSLHFFRHYDLKFSYNQLDTHTHFTS